MSPAAPALVLALAAPGRGDARATAAAPVALGYDLRPGDGRSVSRA